MFGLFYNLRELISVRLVCYCVLRKQKSEIIYKCDVIYQNESNVGIFLSSKSSAEVVISLKNVHHKF